MFLVDDEIELGWIWEYGWCIQVYQGYHIDTGNTCQNNQGDTIRNISNILSQ